ncbi:uncharacterized protein EDB91DRAFT_896281 [Suillus paluster]|uniref:uncharacterized protein n=1 Tax=Suillus paluster TaxID=48578 RepID=UPI001B880838|nr:uncharacterized protein EDB91DRAFT_896281 [Suillus paluster]KAG1727183.1 hypothetical protein EDB91DRAFT_896281 [Suillus paluster]
MKSRRCKVSTGKYLPIMTSSLLDSSLDHRLSAYQTRLGDSSFFHLHIHIHVVAGNMYVAAMYMPTTKSVLLSVTPICVYTASLVSYACFADIKEVSVYCTSHNSC